MTTTTTATSWERVDLMAALSSNRMPLLPVIGARSDGARMFYPGRVHWVFGETESLKTMTMLAVAADLINSGSNVMVIDFEDNAASFVDRLLALGVTDLAIVEHFDYRQPERRFTAAAAQVLIPAASACAIVIIDAATEVMNLHGLKPKDDVDVAALLELLPRPLARSGPAVVVIDHVVKSQESRGRYATGSQHKLSGVDGAAYLLEPVQPFGRGRTGRSRLIVAKDRHGGVRRYAHPTKGRDWFADFVAISRPDGSIVATIEAPPEHPDIDAPFRPTVVMEKVAKAMTHAGIPLSVRGVLDRVKGRDTVIREALAALVDDGYVEATKQGAAQLHLLVKPYPPEDT